MKDKSLQDHGLICILALLVEKAWDGISLSESMEVNKEQKVKNLMYLIVIICVGFNKCMLRGDRSAILQ